MKIGPKNIYDDDNIPEIDLPPKDIEPLPESTRPRKDGPGGDGEEDHSLQIFWR